eukprot:TRINITY_DN26680_c0_g1_i1.p1 TRINITY_DN26680_c0_g1~~TRINITY_DN26680_c0_g1_i1.p1  ORF type:complete len:504 (+),score=97.28 TRINITY_DN26680_c0_g1_i1:196-1707(+)
MMMYSSMAYGQGYGSSCLQTRKSQTPCSFFMQGKCTRGDACSFSHSSMQAQNGYLTQEALGHCGQQHPSMVALDLDDFSDFSDSEDEELLDNPMKSKDYDHKEEDSTLPRTLSTWSTQAPESEAMGEPSSPGRVKRRGASFDATSEGGLTRTGSQMSDHGLADSESEAEEPVMQRISSQLFLPGSPSKQHLQGNSMLKLEVSETSWAAQRRKKAAQASEASQQQPSDEQVVRSIKAILNKLTVEKFDSLSKQLVSCGLRSNAHAELLIGELFEKATTQHHFVDMYADLCTFLHRHFTDHPFVADASDVTDTEGKVITFKKLLLDECQAAFERRTSLSNVNTEDEVAALRYKTSMLGNIKLVGALLSRSMLAGKVGLAILEELLNNPTPESLECAALLLTTAGPALDNPEWNYHAALNHVFSRIAEIVRGSHCKARERFLLKDVLDLRANNWVDKRPKKIRARHDIAASCRAGKARQSCYFLAQPSRMNQFLGAARPFRHLHGH